MDLHRDFFLENRRRLILLLETSFNFSFLWKILASPKRNCIIVTEFQISFLFFYFFSKLFNSRRSRNRIFRMILWKIYLASFKREIV